MTVGGPDHLTLDAVVAFADGEMSLVAYQRAAAHVARCPQCEAEVNQQVVARSWLRAAGTPAIPVSLLDSLRSIPVAMPNAASVGPNPPDAVSGGIGGSDDPARSGHHRGWRFRILGASALVAGLTVAGLVGASDPAPDDGGVTANQHLIQISGTSTPVIVPAAFGAP